MNTSSSAWDNTYLIIAGMLLLLAALIRTSDLMFEAHPLYHGDWMHFGYLRTVEALPSVFSEVPYCWRLLIPAIVWVLPAPVEWGFLFLTLAALAATGLLLFSIVRLTIGDVRVAWMALLAYASMVFVVRINVIEFIAVDAPVFFFMTLALWAILRNKDWLFVLATILGVLTKEVMLLVLPLYFTLKIVYNRRTQSKALLLRRTVLLSLPSILVFIALRMLIVPEQNTGYFAMLVGAVEYRMGSFVGEFSTLNKNLFSEQSTAQNAALNIYRITFGAVGPVLLFILLRFGRIRRELSAWWPLILLTFLQVFIAYDNERIVAIGFPAYIVLFAAAMKSYMDDHGIQVRVLLIFTLLLFLVQLLLQTNHYVQTYYSVAAQLLLGVCMALFLHIKWKIPLSYNAEPQRRGN